LINAQLQQQLTIELADLKICLTEIDKNTCQLQNTADADYQKVLAKAIALDIHGFYSGVERIFENIAKQIDRNPPAKSEQWHKNLLQQMTVAIPNVRDVVISPQNLAHLDELRRFRHVMRSHYAHKLDTDKILGLAIEIPHCYQLLERDLEQFKLSTS
jgi:DNA-directed RNA polymerase